VVVIGYGREESATNWKSHVCHAFNFSVYMDLDRLTYKRFGMGRTFAKVCQSSPVFSYVENFLLKKVPKPFGDNHYEGDDPIQNGGDIIFDSKGQIVFQHLGNAASRPKLDEVLKFLK